MSLPLITLNEDLELNFIELFQINAQDFDLQYLACIFTQLLDFQNRKIKKFQEDALDISQQKNNQQKRQNQIYQKGEKSCLLYMSLIEKEFIVKKTSKSFEKTFGFNSEFIQGKQLNTLIPNLLKKHHNLMIQSFISEQSMDIINLGERSLFGLDNKGFIFPISLRIKLQLLENDFGVCVLIQKKQQIFSYIFFEDGGIITDFSKNIFLDIFQTPAFKSEIQINIFDLIPSIEEIVKTQQSNIQVSTTMVVKQPTLFKSTKSDSHEKPIQSPKNNNNLFSQSSEVFHIKFRFLRRITKQKVNINLIEIDYYQKETDQIKKDIILDQLSKQYSLKKSQGYQKIVQSQQTSGYVKSIQQQYFSTREFSQLFENKDQNQIENKENEKNHLINFQIYQTLEENITNKIDQTPNFVEICEPQSQNNSFNQKTFQEINFFKNPENQSPKTYCGSSELKCLSSKAILDKQSIETLFQNYSRRISTNTFEQPEIILSPKIICQERQQVLINQTNEQQDIVFMPTQNFQSLSLQEILSPTIQSQERQQILIKQSKEQQDIAFLPAQNQLKNQNFQKISSNNASNKFTIKNKSNVIQNKNPIIIDNIDSPFSEEQSLSQELQNLNREQTKKYLQEKEEMKQELKNEIASVNSSKYSTEEILKKKMIQRIQKAKFTNGLQLITFTGAGAFAILSIVSLIIYIQNLKSLDSFVQSFLKIDGAIFCFIDVMNLVGLSNYQSVLRNSQSLIAESLELQMYEINQTDFQQQRTLQDYNLNLQKLVLNNDSGDQLDELQKNLFQVQIYASGFYKGDGFQQNSTTTFEQSLQYTLMEFFYEIVFYYINYEEQQEDFIWGNIYNFKQGMKNLQQIVENYAQDQFNNMNLYQTFAIILFATINALLIFSILPLNILIQSQKEKILKLFGTFTPSSIEFQIKQIELGLYKIEQFNALEQTNNNYAFKQAQNQLKQIKQIKNLNFSQNFLSEQAQKQEKSLNNKVSRYIQRQLDRRNSCCSATFSHAYFKFCYIQSF
ncbi:transmembrane protein, putative (macronuclear) [Tetrahymena thermophila SB210]|uniref:Transmembrane protein, putative n=1 Tax=Tetrahymena thermophila (strain SB210) TaxID=312017 RepID=Q23YC9_TETTS|nr:transmembrane protein, putative [Tetrahymena thermophila SB210]EAS01535.2 transmembrane protein, putative [Tetrahymena thermophila SB210]|eukprot:XP_001021780.2 transmembrane protein, putative [Tetrahymena thermophila SB210]